jgi:ubiquinol-cytochrome c reductase cytochrome b subunit
MHYVANIDLAFISVEHIMRDVQNGFIIRYLHANGASLVFIFLYLHIGKGLFFQSYFRPRFFLWLSGIVIFFLMIVTAFVGYVLP